MTAYTVCLLALLATACAVNPVAPSDRVDVLSYVIGQPWPRIGTQQQHQTVYPDRREVCWTKYGDATMFECWGWDDQWIYHRVDHALDGTRAGQSYRFTDGRWLPRFLHTGTTWTLDLPTNQIIDFSQTCQPAPPRTFPYRLTADATGNILRLVYEPYDGAVSHPESFYFQRGLGWFRWERPPFVVTFDQPGGLAIQPDFRRRCP